MRLLTLVFDLGMLSLTHLLSMYVHSIVVHFENCKLGASMRFDGRHRLCRDRGSQAVRFSVSQAVR